MEDTTMKKTYIIPELEIIKIQAPVIMAGSAAHFDDMGGGELELEGTDPDDGDAMGRGNSFDW